MIALTLAQVESRYGLAHHDHLDREVEIPVVTRLGFQGDVAVVARTDVAPATTPIPPAGYPVVRGEVGSNTHLLVGDGFFTPRPAVDADLVLGTLTVPPGGTTLLSHPEHGGLLIAPGTYVVRRQREQADNIRLVQD